MEQPHSTLHEGLTCAQQEGGGRRLDPHRVLSVPKGGREGGREGGRVRRQPKSKQSKLSVDACMGLVFVGCDGSARWAQCLAPSSREREHNVVIVGMMGWRGGGTRCATVCVMRDGIVLPSVLPCFSVSAIPMPASSLPFLVHCAGTLKLRQADQGTHE